MIFKTALVLLATAMMAGGSAQAASPVSPSGHGYHKSKSPKPPKPVDPGTSATYVVGTISTSNTAVLDVSGTYTCTGSAKNHEDTTATMEIRIVQDGRGRISGEAVLDVKDKPTTTVALTGSLQVSKKTGLHIQFGGGVLILDKGTNLISDSDDTYSGALVQVAGDWDGSQFVCTVKVNRDGRSFRMDQAFVPENQFRGFWIDDGPVTLKGKKLVGTRTIHLPWGTDQLAITQDNKKGFKFSAKSKSNTADLRGTVNDDGTVTLTRARFKIGRLTLDLAASDITVSPSRAGIVQ